MEFHMLILLYLSAIVLANLSVAAFGPGVSIVNAFLFIGLDLTTRDVLHERWQAHLWRNMVLLIATGSILSAALNWNALPIAVASFVAFGLAALVDTVVYQRLRNRTKFVKINGSNLMSAAVDSITFPTLAFGFPLLIPVMVGQFVAKIGGGFIWSLILGLR
jgi:queuosine precursor transporter